MLKNKRMLIIGIILSIFTSIMQAADYIPKGYYTYKDTVYKEINYVLPNFYVPSIIPSLIEHESCISLTHSKCWNPKSRLKTSREEGAGLGQLTRAYRNDGTIRFDTLTELVKRNPRDLYGLNWSTVYDRADLQIRAMLILYNRNFSMFNKEEIDYLDRLAFSDAAYNGGYGGVVKDMQLCKMRTNCNEYVWFDNVEMTCTKGTKILYGNRTACDINRHHVTDVLKNNLPKYTQSWGDGGYISKYPIK